jgi:hypothetical protein
VTQNACNCVSYAEAVVALTAIDVLFKGQCILGIGRTGYRPHAVAQVAVKESRMRS